MKSLFFCLVTLVYLSAHARLTDNQAEIKVDGKQVNITTKTGFHLNAEAPATIKFDGAKVEAKPTTKTEKLFAFEKSAKAKKAELSFYICDDKKTVCEKHEQTLNLVSGEAKKSEVKAAYNNIKDFSMKSTNGKPTLLVFSAPWCPACVRMMTETYPKKEVVEQLKKVNFVKLNSDIPENNELSEKFGVMAIPTLILLDKNGYEAYRWLDFQTAANFSKSLNNEIAKVDLAENAANAAKLGDPAAASVMAFKHFNALDYAEAYKWFSLTNTERDQKFKLATEVAIAQAKAEEDEKNRKDFLQALQKAIVLTTSRLDNLRWSIDYFETQKANKTFTAEGKAKATALIKELDFLIENQKAGETAFAESTYGDYTGFEKTELLWLKGKLLDVLELKAEKEQNNKVAVAHLLSRKLSVDKPGEMLNAISYLREAGEIKKVYELYEKLIAKYPASYVYFEKYARFAQKNKELEKALSLVNEALKFPEGNLPQLSLLKAQILKDLNRPEEVATIVNQALKLDYISHKRYSKTVKKLNELQNEVKDKY